MTGAIAVVVAVFIPPRCCPASPTAVAARVWRCTKESLGIGRGGNNGDGGGCGGQSRTATRQQRQGNDKGKGVEAGAG